VPGLRLTFDDGPDPRTTPALLDLLAARDARATFFPIAPRAAQHPHMIARMLADGHAVGVHCHEHVRHREREPDDVRADTVAALTTLRSLGANPSLWRTPWGDVAPFSAALAEEQGLRIVGWTVDTHDWRGDSAQEMFRRIGGELQDDAIVLAHDGIGPGALRGEATATVELIGMIAAHADECGLQLRALE
jgi:peptidoglycan/xylan/chitin deacetylase (PgdA/CDA1 family)